MAPLPRESGPLQRALLEHLKAIPLTRYRLAEMCGWSPSSIYGMLTRPTNNVNIERMLAAVNAKITFGDREYQFRQGRNLDQQGLPEVLLVARTQRNGGRGVKKKRRRR